MMFKALRYGCVVAHVRGMKSYLLTTGNYDALLKATGVQGVLQVLRGTFYTSQTEALGKKFDMITFEKQLLNDFNDVYRRVLFYANKAARNFLTCDYSRYEAECLKAILRAVYGGMPSDEALYQLVPVGRFTPELCADLLKEAPRKIIEKAVDDMGLRQELIRALPKSEKEGTSLPVEIAIDHFYYSELWDCIQNLEKSDIPIVKRIIGTEIDVNNINIVLRAKSTGLPPSVINDLLVPIRFRLGTDLSNSVHASTVWEALKILASGTYGKILGESISVCEHENSIFPAEMALKRLLAIVNIDTFIGYPFQVGILLAYLNLKFLEVRDLQAILIGKVNELSSERVAVLLVLYGLV